MAQTPERPGALLDGSLQLVGCAGNQDQVLITVPSVP